MFRNCLAAALRNLLRNRVTSFVAVASLAIGCATAIMIALYIRAETSYESFIPGHERVYHVSMDFASSEFKFDTVDQRVAQWLTQDYPEIEAVARLAPITGVVKRGSASYNTSVFAADADFLKVVPFKVLAGDPARALAQPDSVVLSRSAARRYFGSDTPLGETLELEVQPRYASMEEAERGAMSPRPKHPLRVTAVLEDPPVNTHFKLDVLVPAHAPFSPLLALPSWLNPAAVAYTAHTYFRLREGESFDRLRRDASVFIERHLQGGDVKDSPSVTAVFKPIRAVHLSAPGRDAMKPRGSRQTLYALGCVAVLILVIAGSSFVNLMTGRAAQRAVEVGVRKAVGASRRELILQFLGEALLYVLMAMLLALALTELLLPNLRSFAEELGFGVLKAITFEYWRDPQLLLALVVFTLLLTLAAGAYPALVLSAFRPGQVLRSRSLPTSAPARVRYALVVLQFATLIALTYCSTVVYRQLDYALTERLRLDVDHVLVLEVEDMSTPWAAFRDQLRALPGVRDVTSALTAPTNRLTGPVTVEVPGRSDVELPLSLVDHNFMQFYRVPLLAGRHFSAQNAGDGLWSLGTESAARDAAAVLINERAVHTLGLSDAQAAVGKSFVLRSWGMGGVPQPKMLSIIGVVADFPVDSLRVPIAPTIYAAAPMMSLLSVRIDGDRIPATVDAIDRLWSQHSSRAINRWFLSEYYQRLYMDVIQQRRLLALATLVAALIAALGMFALSISMTQQRIKEVGIRKAMGAGTADVMKLLLRTFTKPVLWAQIIAWPAGALLMRRWLEDFEYRVDLGLWWLPASSLIAILIAVATVAAYCYTASKTRPVEALRYE